MLHCKFPLAVTTFLSDELLLKDHEFPFLKEDRSLLHVESKNQKNKQTRKKTKLIDTKSQSWGVGWEKWVEGVKM